MSDFNIEFEENDQQITLEFESGVGGAVSSVNGMTGDVVLTASDVGALPTSTPIPTVDNTLTTAGAAADAKKTGDEISDLKDGLQDIEEEISHLDGLSEEAKQALLACFENAAWIGDDGQDYYDALELALYPNAQLVSISAVFTPPSKNIYDDWSLDDLKEYLVVTAHYDDYSTQTVNVYTLIGTLAVGTSTITVSYGGKTTTFNVTVSAPLYPFTTGTHNFTSPAGTIEVINGNTGIITNSTANVNDIHACFDNLSANTSACNSTNNYAKDGSTIFTIPAGSTVRVKTIINSYENCPSTMKIGSAMRAFSGSTLLAQMMLVEDTLLNTITPGDVIESAKTFNETTAIGCIGMWFGVRSKYVAATINVSYIVYVDDVRYV